MDTPCIPCGSVTLGVRTLRVRGDERSEWGLWVKELWGEKERAKRYERSEYYNRIHF